MMQLEPKLVTHWPKLTWVAELTPDRSTIELLHGPCVETHQQWCVEAAWAGDFGQADFDRTDLVFGSGVRCRDEVAVFVSSATTLDRLWYVGRRGSWYVSNSLPALLAVAGLSLRDDYAGYLADLGTIRHGVQGYKRSFPTNAEDISAVHFSNLVYTDRQLVESAKPDTATQFASFSEYQSFLLGAAEALSDNISDRRRRAAVEALTTLSRGYDSVAAAVIAKHLGCRNAVTICRSSSLWRGSDSGAEIAPNLGLRCATYPRTASHYPLEESVWAAAGRPGILNWTQFDFPEPLCLFLTGCYGDKVWGRRRREYPDPFAGTSLADLGLTEFRLFRGLFHSPIPFWGMRHLAQIQEISFSEEMKAWSLRNNYDRPIPRRLGEEAGVPRRAFGMLKKNTSCEEPFRWPYSPDAADRFTTYLRQRGVCAPTPFQVRLLRYAAATNRLLYGNLLRKLGLADHLGKHLRIRANDMIFAWANHELKQRYVEGLRSANLAVHEETAEVESVRQ
jgi:hypothetical protein